MQQYSEDFKKTMVVMMSGPGAQSATSLANEAGIPQSTLSRWLHDYATVRVKGEAVTQRRPHDWNAEEKLEAILEYERASEEQWGKLLQEKGLHETNREKRKKPMLEALKIKPFTGGGLGVYTEWNEGLIRQR